MDKEALSELLNYISPKLRKYLYNVKSEIWDIAEEILISLGKPAMLYFNGGFEKIYSNGNEIICDKQIVNETLMLVTENSIYAANNKLVNGFITIKGGHRVGVCGTTVINDGKITSFKNISALNIRLKREVKHTADSLVKNVLIDGKISNTLIISPPKCGKTTLLRDFARLLGNMMRVAIIDERGEIAAMYNGVAQNDIGLHTVVIDNCEKHLGIPLAIRCMAPEIILTDEIGDFKDAEAINYAACSGVAVIATAHGGDAEDILKKSDILISFFEIFIVLTNIGGTGTVKKVVRREELAC